MNENEPAKQRVHFSRRHGTLYDHQALTAALIDLIGLPGLIFDADFCLPTPITTT